jgi:hypothetical protein
MYNPEEDIIPYELLAESLALRTSAPPYRVYFDKDTGDILSVTNEPSLIHNCFVEFEFDVVKDFLNANSNFKDFQVTFIDQNTPKIISKYEDDIHAVFLTRAPLVNNWDSMFTIENYPLMKQWGFQLRPDQQIALTQHNLNTAFEIFIVDKDYNNILINSIKIFLKDLLENDRIYIDYNTSKEADVENRIFVKKFFSRIGYQILYDTNS